MPNRVEEAVSKGMGMAKGAKATVMGLTGVFKTLAEQHGEVTALLMRAGVSNDPEKRAELWAKIRVELLSHEGAETTVVYTELRRHAETLALAEHHDDEVDELEALIARVDAADTRSDAWKKAFTKLADTVRHHAKEEENEMFPKAQKVIGRERAHDLDEQLTPVKNRLVREV